ncbi:hypothetical protein FACS18949_17440 [Clostridia bacterium]|nr:hypothetical protein FACS18949_17440 [Clostridia bacterium]
MGFLHTQNLKHKGVLPHEIHQTLPRELALTSRIKRDEKTTYYPLASLLVTLDEMLDGKYDEKKRKQQQQQPPSKRDSAKDFITSNLANGAAPATEIKTLAESAGISKNTLERAKSDLGIKSVQQGGAWLWSLPDAEADTQKTAV